MNLTCAPTRTDSMTTDTDPVDGESGERTNTSRRRFMAGTGALAVGLGGAGATALSTAIDDETMGGGETTTDGGMGEGMDGQEFTVRIENVSKMNTLETSAMGDAGKQAVPISPGAYAVHAESGAVFTAGESAPDNGLEALAEDGMPMSLAESFSGSMAVKSSGAFARPVGADGPGPLTPGNAYEFTVQAAPGDRLSFATMFVPSNDLFFAPDGRGLPLFDGETPISGDVTHGVSLWDAGTEENEEPGVGSHQPQRQMEAGAGTDEGGVVRNVAGVADGYDYPYVSEVVRVTVDGGM